MEQNKRLLRFPILFRGQRNDKLYEIPEWLHKRLSLCYKSFEEREEKSEGNWTTPSSIRLIIDSQFPGNYELLCW